MRGRISAVAALVVFPVFAGVSGDASLVELVKANNQQAAIALIDKHVDVNTPASDGTTALAWAAHNGNVE
jgi:ankyrin repeat protein